MILIIGSYGGLMEPLLSLYSLILYEPHQRCSQTLGQSSPPPNPYYILIILTPSPMSSE